MIGQLRTAECCLARSDVSEEVVNACRKNAYNCRIIVRTTERGLSSAVLRGFNEAASTSKYLICMDADLQHPPEKVPELLQALIDGAPFVLGTRYAPGTSVDASWPVYRRVISAGARALARPLTPLSDPMSGFFGMQAPLYRCVGLCLCSLGL
jgi:dolichol-phosphate mannosyltransferase